MKLIENISGNMLITYSEPEQFVFLRRIKFSGNFVSSDSCAVHAGVGYTCLSKILACADIPMISQALYKRYEREVETVIEEVAKESCKRAAGKNVV
ncbi:hypothetical protein KQX54_015700 [Cotesia glomerata]|uniref:Mutator-like transposase domain-containing protein n=1 Tax=Cotesia glomerata TaxID=32391 RepID=A0AAV7J4P7_COTGL|nr:hypothetical protein KQX54_015700 [Cotesia glomerata]